MTLQTIQEIINQRKILELLLLIVVYNLGWFVTLKLSLEILETKINLIKILFAMIILSAFSFSRAFLIFPIYITFLISFLSLVIMIISRKNFINSFLAALTVISITAIGDILITANPLFLNNKNLINFIFNNIYGNVAISIAELIFPLLALIAFPKIQFFLSSKIIKSHVVKTSAYIIAISIYCLFLLYINYIKNKNANDISNILILLLWTFEVMGILIWDNTIKSYKAIIEKLESEKEELISNISKLKNKPKSSDFDNEMNPIINDFIVQITPVILQAYGKNPSITSKDANLAKLGLDSTDRLILYYIVLDKDYQQIADEIHLTESAIKNRVSKMLKKFKLKNRKELGKFAVENGLV